MKEKESAIIRLLRVAYRECGILLTNHIYIFCMVVFPIAVTFFFTDLMHDGQPTEMPVGVVDLDNSSTTRALIRRLDAFQSSRIAGRYASVADAREAIQRNEIYAFIYFPEDMTDKLAANRQPKISFFYSSTSLTAGALLFRDLKTISTLGSAAVGQSVMSAKGFTPGQIKTFLQPITIDLHPINNPWINYNIYLSTTLVPGILMLFIFLITPYSIGTELKFKTNTELMKLAGDNIWVAILGKTIPQTIIFLIIFYGYMMYVFGHLGFPYQCSTWMMALVGLVSVLAAQGFGIFAFGLMPSLRMSMSICSLWGVLSMTTGGFTFPVFAMDGPIQALSYLFPLRHYYLIYQMCVFNGFPIHTAWINWLCMGVFILLPALVMRNIRKAMKEYVYIP